jgi:hypothetical protein
MDAEAVTAARERRCSATALSIFFKLIHVASPQLQLESFRSRTFN